VIDAMHRRRWTAQEEHYLRLYAARYTAAEIARRFRRKEKAIYKRANRLGIYLLKRGEASPFSPYSDDDVREMLRRYFVEGQSVQGIADALGVPRGSVTMWTAGRSRPHLYREFIGG
jgi:predicted DNA-binding protein YlxM (UPF0122 family)